MGVEEACDVHGRGGFDRLKSQNESGSISFEIYYREAPQSRPITYEVAFDADEHGRPFVASERLRQRRRGQKHGRPFSFLYLNAGRGAAWVGDSAGVNVKDDQLSVEQLFSEVDEESGESETIEMDDPRRLGIAKLGALKQHPRISAFRRFIEGWHLSYFTPDAARALPMAGPQRHLNVHGDNLGNVVQYMEREHPKRFSDILRRIARKIPGINSIDTRKTDDGRLLLRFNESSFDNPFFAQQMSDGTLKVFAYLLLLEDTSPPPFLCIEEPENGLYHRLLETLAHEFRAHATGKAHASQIFITTHQPYLVDALKPEEVWIMERGEDGFCSIRRTSDDILVKDFVAEGLPLGSLWYSDYLDIK